MKKNIILGLVCMFFAASCIIYVPSDQGQNPPYPDEEYYGERAENTGESFGMSGFYDALSPYGFWASHSRYGYVWVPRVDRYDWRPYTYGRWVWTDYGWTWVSRYEWGWIPFHYGRWNWEAGYGWYWVPGHVWSPAWVAWRTSSLYIGWAPLPPEIRFFPEQGILSLGRPLDQRFWIFVNGPDFPSRYIYRYILPLERNYSMVRLTVVKANIVMRNHRVMNRGLDVSFVERMGRTRIHKYRLENSRRADRTQVMTDRVVIYKPAVKKSVSEKPQRVLTREEIKDRVSRDRMKKIQEASPDEVIRRQREEENSLEKSQNREIHSLQTKVERAKSTTKSSVEKERIERDYQAKIKKLKERHSSEKKQVKKRHEKEVKAVKARKIRKKK